MKRKLILSLIAVTLIVAAIFALSACNRNATPQGQLSNFLIDHAKEHFVYDVRIGIQTDDDVLFSQTESLGTLTVDVKACKSGDTIQCPDDITVNNKGVLIKSKLDINYESKHIVYETACYFNLVNGSSLMVPSYTYRIQKENDNETFRMTGNYQSSTFYYEKKSATDEEPTSGSIKLSGTFFDNNEFHQSLRTVSTYSTSFNMSFSLPLVSTTENQSVSLTASCNKTVDVKNDYTNSIDDYKDLGVECYAVKISRSTEVAGLNQMLYYAKDNLKAQNPTGFTMRNVLVEIREPIGTVEEGTQYVFYRLSTATIPND